MQLPRQFEFHFVKQESHIGNTIICPSDWTIEDWGNTWKLAFPNDQARIEIVTFTVAGSDPYDEFVEHMVGMLPIDGVFKRTDLPSVDINGCAAKVIEMRGARDENGDGGETWVVYILTLGDYYHVLFLGVRNILYDFPVIGQVQIYEDVIRSFRGIEKRK